MLRNVLYSVLFLAGTGGHLLAQTDATLPPVVVTPPEVSTPAAPESTGSMQPTPMSNRFEQPLENSPPVSNPPQSVASSFDASSIVWPSSLEQTFATSPSDLSGLSSLFRTDASIIDAAQLATIVDQQTIQQRMSNNMFRALQNEVGVTLQQTGNGQLSPFIRGLTGQQILVMVDGIRVNNSILRAGPNQYAATIDPGMIDRIEVVRGAQSVLWGSDALGGAINIVTRGANPLSADYSRFSFNQVLGSADESSYSRANVEGWVGQSGVFAGGSYLNTNDLDIGGGLGEQPGTGYSQYAGDVKFNRLLDDSTLLTFALQHFEQNDLARSDRFLPFVLGPAPNGNSATQRPTFFDPQQRDLVYLRLNGFS
ncbi:MAG: TonB-dependent receptor plug domain-containing protein [Pirellulaceae bacterium]